MSKASKTGFHHLPVSIQIVRNAPLITFFLKGDLEAIGELVPPPLVPHPDARLIMNVWALEDPQVTTGFGAPGPMAIVYLAAEVLGEEGLYQRRIDPFSS